MYQSKMTVAIKVAGKILREHGDEVYLPFGSEYTLVIKNLNNRRACVRLTIDGQDVVYGGIIVDANSSVDLERFVKAGQLDMGNRLKFIERNEKVEAARGIKVEDGLLRLEFEFEKAPIWYQPNHNIKQTLYRDRSASYFDSTVDSYRSMSGVAQASAGDSAFGDVFNVSTASGAPQLKKCRGDYCCWIC